MAAGLTTAVAALTLAAALGATGDRSMGDRQIEDVPDSAAFGSLLARLVHEGDGDGPGHPQREIGPLVARRVDQRDGAPLTLAYLVGREWCGSGGCTLAVVSGDGSAARLVGWTSVSRPPIQVLSTRSHGMPDLAVRVCGGGVGDCYDAVLAFDGERYPDNPSVPPATGTLAEAEGRVVISESDVTVAVARHRD